MANKITSFEEYLEQSEPFAQPILEYLRECMHEVYPHFTEEIKWKFPCFMYNGSILASVAAFKTHVAFGFWLSKEMSDRHGVFVEGEKMGMGNFGKTKSIGDLPNKGILQEYIREAMALSDAGMKLNKSPKKKIVPENDVFLREISMHPSAKENFDRFTPSQKSEYHEWMNDAKTDATRQKRIAESLEWIAEGKPRNWKYMTQWKNK